MQKVINSHCHIYPDKIAAKAVKGIRDFYDLHMCLPLSYPFSGNNSKAGSINQ